MKHSGSLDKHMSTSSLVQSIPKYSRDAQTSADWGDITYQLAGDKAGKIQCYINQAYAAEYSNVYKFTLHNVYPTY